MGKSRKVISSSPQVYVSKKSNLHDEGEGEKKKKKKLDSRPGNFDGHKRGRRRERGRGWGGSKEGKFESAPRTRDDRRSQIVTRVLT